MNYINEKIYFSSFFWYILLCYVMNPNEYINEKIYFSSLFRYILLCYMMNPNEYINEKITSHPYFGYILFFPPFFIHFRRQESFYVGIIIFYSDCIM